MTKIEEIIITANIIANEGKKPSVALVKGKLTQNQPLPLIISTLKTWQHQPDFIAPKGTVTSNKSQVDHKSPSLQQQVEDAVKSAIAPLKAEIADLKKQIKLLKKE